MQVANIGALYAQPLQMAQQQQNALRSPMGGMPQGGPAPNANYNALAMHGGPTNAAANSVNALRNNPTGEVLAQKMIQRGMPPHIAQAFVLNFQDESGLDPGINEANPLVAGSRGGFGLYQLTGPRRREYEAYAKQIGAPLNSDDAQLDFLMRELQTTEKSAAEKIYASNSTGTAAQAIVKHFLRPSPEHRDRRAAKYARY